MSGSRFTVRLLGATATLFLAAACGNSTPTPVSKPTPGEGTGATKSAPRTFLGVASTSLGRVLVDGRGRTVYLLTADTAGHSTCSAQCLEHWPLVAAPAGSLAAPLPGVSAALAAAKATSGAPIVTAGGWPLYTFVKDKAPGDVAGQGIKAFGGTWYAVSPSGTAVKARAKGSAKVPAKRAPVPTPYDTGKSGANGY